VPRHIIGPVNSGLPKREPSLAEVRSEIQDVLRAREFRQSKALTKLLRYICSKTLIDDAEPVTEYTIALDVLGKSQDFKESKDATVRVEVHRLRKRLADYYEQEGASHALRIVIPMGQYVPQFVLAELETGDDFGASLVEPAGVPAPAGPAVAETEVPAVQVEPVRSEAVPEKVSPPHWRLASRRSRVAVGVVGLAALAVALQAVVRSNDALDRFWRPVLLAPNPILLCVGNTAGGQRPQPTADSAAGLSMLDFHNSASQTMLVSDAATLSRFAGLLQAKGKRYRIVSQSEATFIDLQNGPAVLIGLANNDWTERLVGKLRFWVEHRPPGRLVLRDRDNPSKQDWFIDYSMPYLAVTRDYALVVRVLDPKTEQMVVTAAGISAFGTAAAGEFLTNAQEFRKIEAVAPGGWQKKNFEIVLSTEVIRGKSGHPEIVETHFW
jgi:hypothetical protein